MKNARPLGCLPCIICDLFQRLLLTATVEATPTERTERESQLDQSKRRPDTCSTCKTKAIIKAFSTRLCETHHKLAMDGSLEKRWGKGGRGGGKKINAN